MISAGRTAFEAVAAGKHLSVDEDLVSFGFALSTLGERVLENRSGDLVVFGFDPTSSGSHPVKKRVSESERTMRERYGDGTTDLRPGPRDFASMASRGLYGMTVVSRFFVSRPDGTAECLVAQRIDPYREDVRKHVLEAAAAQARDLGGRICTPVEWYHTGKGSIQEPLTMFVIRRRWNGTLKEYLSSYGLD